MPKGFPIAIFDNAKLESIELEMCKLDPAFEQFAHANGFSFLKGHRHSFNIPRRWLLRQVDEMMWQQVGLIVAAPITERLARGFYPEIPCTLYISSEIRISSEGHSVSYGEVIAEAVPFCTLAGTLPQDLGEAHSRLERCTREFVIENGERWGFP